MKTRLYYSTRTGRNPAGLRLDLSMLLKLFHDLYLFFWRKGYFQESFGYECVDAGFVPGTLGEGIAAQVLRMLRKEGLWPFADKYLSYSEDDLFDVIEFLYDHVSKPIEGDYHDYSECGWHYHTFDQPPGRQEFRAQVNDLLGDYEDGFELSEDGEILTSVEHGMDYLIQAELPEYNPEKVEQRVEAAVRKFRRYRSSQEDRRDAIRDLADVFEFLRPKLKKVLTTKDEADLFNLANNFGIRHHNPEQKTEYDKPIWYSWMFYYYLATIHAALRLIKKREATGKDR